MSEDQQGMEDPFYKIKPERIWLSLSNVCDRGKFKVTLKINGQERELFNSYAHQEDGTICHSHSLTWLLNSEKARADQAEAELAMLRAGIEAEAISNTRSIYRGTAVMEMNQKLQTENAALKAALDRIADDSWYKNGFVPSEDEQIRRGILMDRCNEVRKVAKEALAAHNTEPITKRFSEEGDL